MNDLVFFSFDLLYLTHSIHSFVIIIAVVIDVVVASSLNGVGQQKPKPEKKTHTMLFLPSTRFSSRILSTVLSLLVTSTFFCQPGLAFPDLAGLVKERRGASHAHHLHHDAVPIDKREAAGGGGAGEEEAAAAAARELYARQLGALTGLLGSTVSELGG